KFSCACEHHSDSSPGVLVDKYYAGLPLSSEIVAVRPLDENLVDQTECAEGVVHEEVDARIHDGPRGVVSSARFLDILSKLRVIHLIGIIDDESADGRRVKLRQGQSQSGVRQVPFSMQQLHKSPSHGCSDLFARSEFDWFSGW